MSNQDQSLQSSELPSTSKKTQKFSVEEMAVLQRCNLESFYQRSLPIGLTLGYTCYLAINKGFIKPNPRFGYLPKISFAIMAGFLIGKFSYQKKCAERLMALPDSYIGQILRNQRDAKMSSLIPNIAPMDTCNEDIENNQCVDQENFRNFDTNRPAFEFDVYQQNSSQRSIDEESAQNSFKSYDKLRNKNRVDYYEGQKKYNTGTFEKMPKKKETFFSNQIPKTNVYGDVTE